MTEKTTAVNSGYLSLGSAYVTLREINKALEEGENLLVVGLRLKALEYDLYHRQSVMHDKMVEEGIKEV